MVQRHALIARRAPPDRAVADLGRRVGRQRHQLDRARAADTRIVEYGRCSTWAQRDVARGVQFAAQKVVHHLAQPAEIAHHLLEKWDKHLWRAWRHWRCRIEPAISAAHCRPSARKSMSSMPITWFQLCPAGMVIRPR